ncbi:ATP-utilizing chromatin assembly and remodelling N-terminal-domain-containing protein [Fomitopsis serialis]|uniref:ATP-utilizing chromatin assembly and remodelling N-terminal-domain-containing protein n=1 Tax=Fomitopsis serialis TaxID=139415 RepID=UPI00200816B7|nr:ATP-utilizing chromatin assembly and remodelling N-terminal-domain-containing protein [Neoantrodia serialis]KAH9937610.1 ATP-utilizing chromatin assembly and remodelling N-terminal-domain-containing protein [Neoantrodia serialis]
MPTCRRKRVVLIEPTPELLLAAKTNPNKEVYFLGQTGEIFETYEAYAARMSFYRLKQFQCEVTGKSGLDYFQAMESERQEARTMHSRFPDPLKAAVLRAVQWQVMGRLDHLVEEVYQRFKDRFYPNERVLVEIEGEKCILARLIQVMPPKTELERCGIYSTTPLPDDFPPLHKIAEDIKIPVKEGNAKDDPAKYVYKVQILDPEQQPGSKSHDKHKGKDAAKFSGRDRLTFSKSILRRFIRDCVDRAPAVASPWTVKTPIALRYGVNTVMPEETRRGVDAIKKGETDKRKKVWEEKEGPVTKKQKKMTAAAEEKVKALAAAAEKRDQDAREKAEKAQHEKERLAAEKAKKKPIRYPTEDLDVVLGDREKRAGMKLKRPVPSRVAMPFAFLMVWNFLVVYGQPLHLSPFTMDEFEAALQIHATLVYNLRTVPFQRHSAVMSLYEEKETANGGDDLLFGVSLDQLIELWRIWGWEESLIGCLKDHADYENFPQMREIFTKLLFAPEPATEASTSATSSPSSSPAPVTLAVLSHPSFRYYTLSAAERVAILAFMCNLAISSKAIHSHMERCEEQLTALRKEKIEVNRTKKQYLEEMGALGDVKAAEAALNGNAADQDVKMQDSSDLSDLPGSDDETERRRKETRRTAAKDRELARVKAASTKQAIAEHRRLDEEVNKLERRLEGIEREFRKLLGSVRAKPLGKDRFYNRIWWFDGMGAASLVGSGGTIQYGSGRVFVQGPSEFDIEILQRREGDVTGRRKVEEGEEGMLGVGEWAVFNDLEELDAFVAWLNPKGVRELALKNAFSKWWSHLAPGMRRRSADLAAKIVQPEARRSMRTKHAAADISREPYMQWTNKKGAGAS